LIAGAHDTVKFCPSTLWAALGPPGSARLFPVVTAVMTLKKPCRIDHFKISSLDIDGLAVDDGVGNCLAGPLYNAAECGA
jgi:hypothetical protein